MDADKLFEEMYGAPKDRLIRGASMGMTFEEVKDLEAAGEQWETEYPFPTLEVIYRLLPDYENEYSIVYMFSDDRKLVEVDFFFKYAEEPEQISFTDYQQITAAFDQYFRQKLGKPKQDKIPVEDYEEVSYAWVDRSAEPPLDVIQMYYPDHFNDKPRVMKLIFQEHHD
jgi:hypothetical protein